MKLRQSKLKLGITKSPKSTFLENTWSRKRNGRVNGSPNSNTSKLAAPEEKRKRNGRVNGGSVQNTGPGRKTEEKRKGKRKRVISAQMEKIVLFLWISFPCTEHAPHTSKLFLLEWIIGLQQEP